jgi:hypothetical protein
LRLSLPLFDELSFCYSLSSTFHMTIALSKVL